MDKKVFAVGLVATILAAIAPSLLAHAPSLSLDAFVFPEVGEWWHYALRLSPALFLLLLGLVMIKSFVNDRTARVAFWSAAILSGLAVMILMNISLLPGTFIFATYLGGYFPLLTDDPCKRGVWKTATAPKGFAALVVFLLAYLLAVHTQGISDQFINRVVEMSLASAGAGSGIDINTILSPNVTESERQQLIKRIQESTPDWDQLSESQRQALINNYLQAYAQTKKVIYQTLASSIHAPSKKQLAATLRKQVEQMPIMQKIVKFLPAIVGFSVAIYYTLVEFLAELAAFLVGFPLVWLLRRTVGQG